jgi:hypothetical protein
MSQGRERLSHSEAVHRRTVLAGERRKFSSDFWLQEIANREQAIARFGEVRGILEQTSRGLLELDIREQVSLEVERIWLEFRLEQIKAPEKDSRLQRTLNLVEKEEPKIYQWLISENSDGLTPLAKIRNRVFPPGKIRGYHTKRM